MNSAQLPFSLLSCAHVLVDGIQSGMSTQGFDDLRPAHGFLFARVSGAGCTTSDIAAHLGVTKQAASQMTDQLVESSYLERVENPRDKRSTLIMLTPKGVRATRAAEECALAVYREWESTVGTEQMTKMGEALAALAVPGRLRPLW